MSSLRPPSSNRALDDLANAVAVTPPEPFGYRANRRKLSFPIRPLGVKNFLALAVCLYSFSLFYQSLDARVFVYGDAMSDHASHGPASAIGWDYIKGPFWREGLFFWPVWLMAGGTVLFQELLISVRMKAMLRLARISMFLIDMVAVVGRVLSDIASGLAWAGPQYGRGMGLWLASLWLMFLATLLAGTGTSNASTIAPEQRGFEVVPK